MKLFLNSHIPSPLFLAKLDSCGIHILSGVPEEDSEYLIFFENGLTFVDSHLDEKVVVRFDFLSLLKRHKFNNYAITKEPLAKSLGMKGETMLTVLDATCGTGADSMLMLSFGAKVYAYERNEVIYALLLDALQRAKDEPLIELFSLTFGDPSQLLVEELPAVDTIYLDPMYDHGKRKAKQKKEMIMFSKLLGESTDDSAFVKWALTISKNRVVVKRPLRGKKIIQEVTATYCGKSTRYDMYKA